MSTIHDVAQRAGVSAKTVSRVLNDHASVTAKTRDKVREAMSALGYQPSAVARQFRAQGSSAVGALMGDPSGGYHTRTHHALLLACLETGRHLTVELFDGPIAGWQDRIRAFVEDGGIREVVLLPPECDFGPLKALLRELEVRCVLISPTTPDPHFPAIAMDDRAAAREVVEHLFSLGHTRIGHISGHPDHAASTHRRNGFFEAYAAAGLPRPAPELIVQGEFTFKTGLDAARLLLEIDEPPTAIFAANDEMAAATCMEAQRRGLRIPDDISVVGFDDAPIAGVIWPTLTTIRQPFEPMALRALQTFAAWNSGESGLRTGPFLAQHSLVIRESTGPARKGPPAKTS
ncbi:LacI family transcriptional regulator [Caulobacter sp. D4A]|uniref:LacI family DNA-binding transcriptional regulator n=1 Tax=unclassified Caulobacter TaxID=2648921 RepID=UPI000D726DDD|nr:MULTISPECIES: LacI family DNA-binding transcriptional regulator [unclassified Caulobacter]PXA88240.1 LacI family transcriptional regulator [Caulobacter sp. D5]PXA89914.1 LacI family transcriptional regulator [Caulobacter sp. D4A]